MTAVHSIHVVGSQTYPGENWREAIISYLNGIWSGKTDLRGLYFNNTCVRLSKTGGEYYLYFRHEQDGPEPQNLAACETVWAVSYPALNDMEIGLIRFVRNNSIRQLVLTFPGVGNMTLTKGQKRSELFISTAIHLSSMKAEMRRNGHRI